eukprot:TRINITY_DN3146_c0_g1_i1.p1 TRINITY_DN3146_c0_g1~~TRINITY_DN3146_c0_g1_i1.p1  ORF type:complete len:127 (+),score=19.69 TRINITY_DN3146_c0_g1_i1:51-431(+)
MDYFDITSVSHLHAKLTNRTVPGWNVLNNDEVKAMLYLISDFKKSKENELKQEKILERMIFCDEPLIIQRQKLFAEEENTSWLEWLKDAYEDVNEVLSAGVMRNPKFEKEKKDFYVELSQMFRINN